MKIKHHPSFYITCILTSLTIILTLVFSHTNNFVSAESTNAAVSVSSVCAVTTTDNGNHIVNLIPGEDSEIVGISINVSCNDGDGYSLYAIGFSGDSYTASNHTKLISTIGTDYDIATNTSGDNSYWAMKVTPSGTNTPIIDNSYDTYQVIPDTYTKISHLTTSTFGTTNNSVTTPTYKVNISSNQVADTYTGKVKYTLVHPNTTSETSMPTLYDIVASMSKGTQTAADLQATITTPTSSNPSTDTSNSGVYEYDASVFGVASDASNDYKIYYYRGILDSSFASSAYGSSGDGAYYPNYVRLGDTCWRIVRTTASGGVKMIYNGLWTGSTCANAQNNTQARTSNNAVGTKNFNGTSSTYQQTVRMGYTYNNTYAINTTKTATIAEILGSDSNPSANNTSSSIKKYIEDEWFPTIGNYEQILETSAGYCNDRSVYNNTSPYTLLEENTNIASYGASGVLHFGSDIRNNYALDENGNRKITLHCARGIVDLYTVTGSSTGNGQLSKPIALLTADEAAFAGSGSSVAMKGSASNSSSFLRSGNYFWLLSPYYRTSNGYIIEFGLTTDGALHNYNVNSALGVRPVISLASGTTAASGSGTAASPWIINPPSS